MNDNMVYGFQMARITEVYLSTLSAMMKPHGLERNFSALLFICENNGKATQKDLADALRKDKVTTMRIVDHLCEKGFVERVEDKEDRRCHILKATPEAIRIRPHIKKAVTKTNRMLTQKFTKKEKVVFESCMLKLLELINTLPEPEYKIEAFKSTSPKQ